MLNKTDNDLKISQFYKNETYHIWSRPRINSLQIIVFASNFFKTNNPIAWEKCGDIEQIDKYNDISYIDDST